MSAPGVAAFVLARMDEVEAEARAAIGTSVWATQTGRWVHRDVEHGGYTSLIVFAVAEDHARTQVADLTAAWEGPERAVHIARNDPARVLAEVAAKRAIVALHHTSETPERLAQIGVSRVGRDPSCSDRDYPEESDDCLTLLTLAALDADHPDYDPGWAL